MAFTIRQTVIDVHEHALMSVNVGVLFSRANSGTATVVQSIIRVYAFMTCVHAWRFTGIRSHAALSKKCNHRNRYSSSLQPNPYLWFFRCHDTKLVDSVAWPLLCAV